MTEAGRSKIKYDTISKGYMLFIAALYPLYTGFCGYIDLTASKFYCYALATLLWAAAFVCCIAAKRCEAKALLSENRTAKSSAVFAAVFCFFASFSALFSENFVFLTGATERYDGLFVYLLYALTFFAALSLRKIPEKLPLFLAAAYGLCCLVMILQICGLNPLQLYPNHLNYYSPFVIEVGRLTGTMGNPDVMSAYHCLMLPLCASCFFRAKDIKRRILWALLFFTGLFCMIFAKVASGILALAVTSVLTLSQAVFNKQKGGSAGLESFEKPRAVSAKGLAVSAFLLIAAAAAIYLIPFESGTPGELRSVLHGDIRPEFGSRRIATWAACLEIVKEHPLFGIGPENLTAYTAISYSRFSDLIGAQVGGVVDNAHNEYLQLLVNFGAAGFVPAISAAVSGLVSSLRKPGARIFAPSIICYMIQAFFNIGLCFVTPLFVMMLGLCISCV